MNSLSKPGQARVNTLGVGGSGDDGIADDKKPPESGVQRGLETRLVLLSGSILAFVCTPIAYVCYALTEQPRYHARHRQPLPIITDMFTDWPLLSSILFGTGMTMLFAGILVIVTYDIPAVTELRSARTILFTLSLISIFSLWPMLASSRDTSSMAGSDASSFNNVHHVSTFFLMVSAIVSLYEAKWMCAYFAHQLVAAQEKGGREAHADPTKWLPLALSAAEACFWVALAGVVGATASVLATLWAADNAARNAPWQVLACCEILVLECGGIGYFWVIYAYAILEERARGV